jgi:hypothetical protein
MELLVVILGYVISYGVPLMTGIRVARLLFLDYKESQHIQSDGGDVDSFGIKSLDHLVNQLKAMLKDSRRQIASLSESNERLVDQNLALREKLREHGLDE